MKDDPNSLAEKWRPTCLGEVVGQDRAVRTINLFIDRGAVGGRAWLISGPSGTGKTTLAKLVANEIAEPSMTQEMDGTSMTTRTLRKIEEEWKEDSWSTRGRAYVIDEAHLLKRVVVEHIIVSFDRTPNDVVWIFTTTEPIDGLVKWGSALPPFISRCTVLELSRRDLAKPFGERCKIIAEAEGLDGQPVEKYVRLAQMKRNNMRAMLAAIEAGDMAD